jgi:hypothetical protein
VTGIDKALIAKEFARIRAAHGGLLTPAIIEEEARPHNAVLHTHFEWDDAKAGYAHRLEQARALIKVVVMVSTSNPDAQVVVPVYVSERNGEGERTYVPQVEILNDKQRRDRLVCETIERARDILRRVADPECQKLADYLEKKLRPFK